MKKLFLFLVSAFAAVFAGLSNASAQSSLLATLHHNGEIKCFYGASALREANAVAVHGDVITLSSGSFSAPDTISQAITLRGAGMQYDSVSVVEPTVITGNIYVYIDNDSTAQNHGLVIEGIYHDYEIYLQTSLKKPQFVKCRLNSVYNSSSSSSTLDDANFIHCLVKSFTLYYGSSSFVNCYVENLYKYYTYDSNIEFLNCVLQDGNISSLDYVTYRNCILYGTNTSYSSNNKIPSTSLAYNCVGVTKTETNNIFYSQLNKSNKQVSSLSEVFKTWTGNDVDDFNAESFELTDSAKVVFLGGDGTQVGIYGGNLPFDPMTSNPRITKCVVAGKTTPDGKLSVQIEVNGKE